MSETNTLTLEQVESWRGRPLVLFVGIRTGESRVHAVFPHWAAVLDRPWSLRGVDLPHDTPPATYRRLVAAIRDNPAVQGGVVTAHKLRLYRSCAADLSQHDSMVELTEEVNTLAATDGTIRAFARDPLSLARVLPGAQQVVCLGAGGAGTALLLALHELDPSKQPAYIAFADSDPGALDDLRAVADRAGIDSARLSFTTVRGPEDCDALVAQATGPSLVINATGLGKDKPGSPVTDQAPFGPETLAWDFNYRGDLRYLRQAAARGAGTLDGWDYFVSGWAGGLSAIAGAPFTDDLLTRFGQAAGPHRPGGAS